MSIIVPVYNVEKYLPECLDSLVNQTLKNIEIIVVNDCSPDNSEAVILEYAAKDERIVYIKHEENKRQGAARNTGIKAARGEYIVFVDSDDYIDRSLCAQIVHSFRKYQAAAIFFPIRYFRADKYLNIDTKFPAGRKYHLNRDDYALSLAFVMTAGKAYRRKDLEQYEVYFPENTYWEDIVFWIEYCCAVQPDVVDLSGMGPGYWCRQHEESTNGQKERTSRTIPVIFFPIYQILKKHDLLDKLHASFSYLVYSLVGFRWGVLEEEYQMEFIRHFEEFIEKISHDETSKSYFPQWYILSSLPCDELKVEFMHMYAEKYNAQNNHWYRFGLLSGRQKFVKILRTAQNRLMKAFQAGAGKYLIHRQSLRNVSMKR